MINQGARCFMRSSVFFVLYTSTKKTISRYDGLLRIVYSSGWQLITDWIRARKVELMNKRCPEEKTLFFLLSVQK
jgi:hypothetical protein